MTLHRAHLRVLMAVLIAAGLLLSPALARADDSVTEWSKKASEAVILGGTGQGAIAFPHMAMVHAAMFDAVNAIDRRYEPYLVAPPAKRWFSQDAAAITAAYRVLVDGDVVAEGRRVALKAELTPVYDAAIAALPPGRARNGGVATGNAAAWWMIAERADDGRWGDPGFFVPEPDDLRPGNWVPTSGVNDPGAWLQHVDPFFVRNPDRFLTRGPHPVRSKAYAREYAEVKRLGEATSTARLPDQTDAARFWGVVNPVATWAELTRTLANLRPMALVDRARFYALIWLNTADTGIATWRDKAKWLFWRPVTAINQGDSDRNPLTRGQVGWTPLIGNPPYPDHASGLSAVGASITHTVRELLGTDQVTFGATVTPATGAAVTREFTRLSQARQDIVDARVWSGIHFRAADEQGAQIGREVAEYRRAHGLLRPRR